MAIAALALAVILAVSPAFLNASDHDDGETDTKGRNLNLTDVYAFREVDQNSAASANDLILIMNTNPRSVARQQYYFSTNARYEFKITRVASNNATPTGKADVTLRFEFGGPDAARRQKIKVTSIQDGQVRVADTTVGRVPIQTTPLNTAPIINQVSLGGGPHLTLFAGLREDPFFFDVEQFFRVRAGALGFGSSVGFRPPGTGTGSALDFTAGYNVNSIVIRVPLAALHGSKPVKTFDVWATISVPGAGGAFTQVERLARPAINEGLIVTNDFLNALNSVGPDVERAFLDGTLPPDVAAFVASIVAEAKATLEAFGNFPTEADALLAAFLPDVMRIDTTGPSGYANDLNASGSPIRGRKITDDVIDITLTVVTKGAVTMDNVSYTGPNANGSGHQPLLPGFPYLAPPN